jgi:hypothetical protein
MLGEVLNRAYAKTGGYYSKYGGKYYSHYGKYGYGNAEGAYYGQSTR